MGRKLLGLALLMMAAGCATTDGFVVPWQAGGSPPIGEVAEVGVIWAEGLEVKADPTRQGAPVLGFVGRVYLFGPDHATPLAAHGSLSVQLYDDAQKPMQPPVPREVWNIDQANLDRVLKKDGLGWGYNLWLPWNSALHEVTKVSLVVQYVPTHGNPVWSAPAVLTVKEGGKGRIAATLDTTGRTTAPARHEATQISSFHVPKGSSFAPASK